MGKEGNKTEKGRKRRTLMKGVMADCLIYSSNDSVYISLSNVYVFYCGEIPI